ncbi:hypothetical protein M514_03066 [Trichuris suis]|uniref:Uncharacterized protein n=1 Tax=Trichuris suis TaxID=68888 RepID=A0A085NFQ5_9BILA|nr:hypothetical protein M514_03066 [Trichuris suis]
MQACLKIGRLVTDMLVFMMVSRSVSLVNCKLAQGVGRIFLPSSESTEEHSAYKIANRWKRVAYNGSPEGAQQRELRKRGDMKTKAPAEQGCKRELVSCLIASCKSTANVCTTDAV